MRIDPCIFSRAELLHFYNAYRQMSLAFDDSTPDDINYIHHRRVDMFRIPDDMIPMSDLLKNLRIGFEEMCAVLTNTYTEEPYDWLGESDDYIGDPRWFLRKLKEEHEKEEEFLQGK